MSNIVLISGSPSVSSGSNKILNHVGSILQQENFTVDYVSVQDIPLDDLFYGNFNSPIIQKISEQIKNVKGIVIAFPVYKAAFTGILKSLIDILPQDSFKSKPVLPIMTGGSMAHLLALEYSLKPLIAILKGHSLRGVYILDTQIDKEKQNPIIDEAINNRINQQTNYFVDAIREERLSILQ